MESVEPVRYWIDAADRLAAVNDAWDTTARANEAVQLLKAEILGRPFWDFIVDPGIRHVYQTIVNRVRRGGGLVRFTFSCLAPEQLQFLQMEISAQTGGQILFEVSDLTTQPGSSSRSHKGAGTPSGSLLRMCGWCKQMVMPDGSFADAEDVITALNLFECSRLPPISHGMCPPCAGEWGKSLSKEAAGRFRAGDVPNRN